MRRGIFFIIVISVLLINSYYTLAEEIERGLWVWNSKEFMGDEEKMDKFFEFIEAPHGDASKKINTVYLHPYGYLEKEVERYKTFIRKASSKGIRVEYMTGNAAWAHQHFTPLKKLDNVIEYNKAVEPEERFYGIHWDIEAHILPVFKKEEYKEKIVTKYIELLKACREKIDASGMPLRLTVDLPTFYKVDYFVKVCEYVDCIVLMDYRDSYIRILTDAQKALEAGNRKSRQIIIGVETQEPNSKWGVTSSITFYEEGYIKMEEVLAKLTNNLSTMPAFSGIAIHHYDSYLTLAAEGKEPIEKIKYPSLDEIVCIYKKRIKIDGNILRDEWRFARPVGIDSSRYVVYGGQTWKNAEDLSAVAWTAWDRKNLYFALKVIDDRIVQTNTGSDLLNGDHVEVWIDADYKADIDCPVPNDDDFHLGFSPGNFDDVGPDMLLWYPDSVKLSMAKKQVDYAFQKTNKGYDVEISIPWKFLGVRRVKRGKKFRINIDPSDTDNSDLQECLMSTSPHRKLANPRTFRTLILKK